jgi:GxxExxY protein
MKEDDVTSKIIGAAIEVHKHLGPGLLESAYEICLAHELRTQGLIVESQITLPVVFKGMKLEAGYRLDLLVEKLSL